jgi:phosphatidate cytidylyltransferase
MSAGSNWSDLAPRIISGIAMLMVGALAVWMGGAVFNLALLGLAGLMAWEAARMFGATGPNSIFIAVECIGVLALCTYLPGYAVLPLVGAIAIAGAGQVNRDKPLFGLFLAWILLASFAMYILRGQAGLLWVLWLICIVIISDIAGYFAGKSLGGPKFWPRISPKKTWSGTLAGWIGAGIVGMIFMVPLSAGITLIWASVLVGFAGQMGDIAESAVKRRTGVKDSSDLIPGHGGVLDRFDGMLGASMLVMILWVSRLLPGLT